MAVRQIEGDFYGRQTETKCVNCGYQVGDKLTAHLVNDPEDADPDDEDQEDDELEEDTMAEDSKEPKFTTKGAVKCRKCPNQATAGYRTCEPCRTKAREYMESWNKGKKKSAKPSPKPLAKKAATALKATASNGSGWKSQILTKLEGQATQLAGKLQNLRLAIASIEAL